MWCLHHQVEGGDGIFLHILLYDVIYWEKAVFAYTGRRQSSCYQNLRSHLINAHFAKFNKPVWVRVYLRMKWL
jgi:hypothetical protein